MRGCISLPADKNNEREDGEMMTELRNLIEKIEAMDLKPMTKSEGKEDSVWMTDEWTEITNAAAELAAAAVREYLTENANDTPERIEEYITGIYDACDGWTAYLPPGPDTVLADYKLFWESIEE